MGIVLDNEYSQLFSNKLRMDLQSSYTENISFGANFDFITYHGKTNWNMLDYIPDEIASTVSRRSRALYEFNYNDTLFLDNAFVKLSVSKFDITLGKQQISLGTGYAWNPTDLFNIKDLADPTYEQPGHNAIRLDVALSPRYSAMLLGLPENDIKESAKLASFKGKLSHFDYSLSYIEKQWSLSDFIANRFTENKRRLYGGDLVGELFGLGVWSEFGYNTLKNYHDFWEILLGVDYTLDNGIYLMTEYYHNGMAKGDYKLYNLNDWMRFYIAESRSVSKDNLFLYCSYPLTDLLQFDNSLIVSLSDRSFGIAPSLNYSLHDNVEMNMFLNHNFSSEGKAYSKNLGTGFTLRLRIYF